MSACARALPPQSSRGANPLEGWRPSVPEDGFDLAPGTEAYQRYETEGIAQAGGLGFVVPAGGLGERLGYSGVKFALPSEISSGTSVLGVYCGYIRAVQRLVERASAESDCEGGEGSDANGDVKAGERATSTRGAVLLPLAIMVSSDTEAGITQLLEQNDYYGLRKDQARAAPAAATSCNCRAAVQASTAACPPTRRHPAAPGMAGDPPTSGEGGGATGCERGVRPVRPVHHSHEATRPR